MGIHVDSFPNLYIALGPTGLSFSMQAIQVCEENTQWAAQMIAYLQDNGIAAAVVKRDALEKVAEANQHHAERTVWARCQSYYNDDKGNILIMVRRWDEVIAEKAALRDAGYPGFEFLR